MHSFPYKIFSLGDSALTIDFGNFIDPDVNAQVVQLFNKLKQDPINAIQDVIPAYSSLTVFYDPAKVNEHMDAAMTAYEVMAATIGEFISKHVNETEEPLRLVRIPVCYHPQFAPDLSRIASEKNISVSELIQIHQSRRYKVYMLGFLPGFPYMGEVDDRIIFPRKAEPVRVSRGSVGIAGKQTGIYPLDSPGGWQIIGRTPLRLFDSKQTEFCLLKPGDEIEFFSIDADEFENY